MEGNRANPPKVTDERVLLREVPGLLRAAHGEPGGRRALAVVLNRTPPLLSEVTTSMGVTVERTNTIPLTLKKFLILRRLEQESSMNKFIFFPTYTQQSILMRLHQGYWHLPTQFGVM